MAPLGEHVRLFALDLLGVGTICSCMYQIARAFVFCCDRRLGEAPRGNSCFDVCQDCLDLDLPPLGMGDVPFGFRQPSTSIDLAAAARLVFLMVSSFAVNQGQPRS